MNKFLVLLHLCYDLPPTPKEVAEALINRARTLLNGEESSTIEQDIVRAQGDDND